MATREFRIEHDSMGELQVPADALWGASTQRAVENFPVSGRPMPRGFIRALGLVKAAAAETDGLCTVWEGDVPPGTVGAGPHYHRARDEFFYVLRGELVLRIGDEHQTAPAGTFAFIPRGTVHGFRNAGTEDAALLVMHHPAGFEQFLEAMRELAARKGTPEERARLAARYDMFPVPDRAGA